MGIEHILGIGCTVLVLGFIIYKRLTRGETLKDIYKKIDAKEAEEKKEN